MIFLAVPDAELHAVGCLLLKVVPLLLFLFWLLLDDCSSPLFLSHLRLLLLELLIHQGFEALALRVQTLNLVALRVVTNLIVDLYSIIVYLLNAVIEILNLLVVGVALLTRANLLSKEVRASWSITPFSISTLASTPTWARSLQLALFSLTLPAPLRRRLLTLLIISLNRRVIVVELEASKVACIHLWGTLNVVVSVLPLSRFASRFWSLWPLGRGSFLGGFEI